MTARTRTLLVSGALALLALCLMPGTAAAVDKLTINVTETDVNLGDSTVIRGMLSSDGPEASQQVTLRVRKFPYKRERVVKSTFTGTGGTYFFRVRPTLNARYRVTFGATTSPRVRVYVYPSKGETDVRTISGNRAKAHFFLQFPRDYPLRLSGRRVTWYFRKANDSIFRKIATSKSRATETKRMYGNVTFDLPDSRTRYRYVVTWCFAIGREGQDIGVGRKAGGGCPRRFRDDDA